MDTDTKTETPVAVVPSINEPPGSNVYPLVQPMEAKASSSAKPQPEMPKVSRDPDDIEAEIEAAKDDGDVKTGKKSGKR
jgi:hypothetical protein